MSHSSFLPTFPAFPAFRGTRAASSSSESAAIVAAGGCLLSPARTLYLWRILLQSHHYPNPTPFALCPQRQRPYHRHYRRAGGEICDRFRAQSERFGTSIITETVDTIEAGSTPFLIHTSTTTVEADTVVIATGAVARRLEFPGSIEFWCARVLSLVLDTRKPPPLLLSSSY